MFRLQPCFLSTSGKSLEMQCMLSIRTYTTRMIQRCGMPELKVQAESKATEVQDAQPEQAWASVGPLCKAATPSTTQGPDVAYL